MDEKTFFRLMQSQNLNCVSMFYKHVSIAIRDVAKNIDNWDELDIARKTWWKEEFETHYPQQMLNTKFLLMFGHLEEMLVLLQRSFNPELIEIDTDAKGIKKFKPYIKNLLGDDLRGYPFLLDAYRIRNSLIHCAGRISLMSDPSKVQEVIDRHPNCFGRKHDRIHISRSGLSKLQQSIHQLTERLINHSSLSSSPPNNPH